MRVEVSREAGTLTIDRDGAVLFFAPVTSGSEHDPLPTGDWKVKGVAHDPPFRYSPDLFWDSEATDSKAVIPPGPNNLVGVVWIDLDKPHYGLHGTPEPRRSITSRSVAKRPVASNQPLRRAISVELRIPAQSVFR